MTTTEISLPDEFASTMQQLVAEAEKVILPRKDDEMGGKDQNEIRSSFASLNHRIAGMEQVLSHNFDKLAAMTAAPSSGDEVASQLQRMFDNIIAIRNTESVNQRLFNSLHQELKSYRDNFLRDSLQKPFIRDLVVLYDDMTSLSIDMESAGGSNSAKKGAIRRWHSNLENAIHSLVEILHRMEVVEIEPREKVDRALHRVVSYEPADSAEDDGLIVARVKRGFVWHDQVLRPEEVIAKRFAQI